MANLGIQPELLEQLRKVLLGCGPFKNNNELKAIFVDERIHPWHNLVPQMDSPESRVDALIEVLHDQFREGTGENALILFLLAVRDKKDSRVACRKELDDLARKLKDGISGESIQITPASQVCRDPNATLYDLSNPFSESPPDLDFTNRSDEIRDLISSHAPAWYLIDAPAKYGKTKLLHEVQYRLREEGWQCAYVRIIWEKGKEVPTLSDIVQALLEDLQIMDERFLSSIQTESDFYAVGVLVGDRLKSHLEEIKGKCPKKVPGIALLIDLDEYLPDALILLVQAFLTKFIPMVEKTLRNSALFQLASIHNPFRVIVACRYLRYRLEDIDWLKIAREFEVLRLKPFSYKSIQDAARRFLGGDDTQITPYLMHYTAGHPGCMAEVLQLYRGWHNSQDSHKSPEHFFDWCRDRVWEIVEEKAGQIRQNIPSELRQYFDVLSVFRYLDYDILYAWMNALAQPTFERPVGDQFDLYDKLLHAGLMAYEDHLLKDSITRRLVVLWLLRNRGSAAFRGHCQQAEAICASYLRQPTAQMLNSWAIEMLFQTLQQHAAAIHNAQERMVLRKTFFEETVPQVLVLLTQERNNCRGIIANLEHELEEAKAEEAKGDWEFAFTVNYFLREDQYNDAPYTRLKEMVHRFWIEMPKEV